MENKQAEEENYFNKIKLSGYFEMYFIYLKNYGKHFVTDNLSHHVQASVTRTRQSVCISRLVHRWYFRISIL